MDLAGTDVWDGALAVLKDPLFAVLLAVFLAFLGSQAGWRLVKTLLFCGAVGVFVWVAVNYPSAGEAAGAIAGAVVTIALWLLAAVTVVTVAVVVGVLVMYLRSEPLTERDLRPLPPRAARDRRRWSSSDDEDSDDPILDWSGRFDELAERLVELLPDLDRVDGDNPFRMAADLARLYFSGLSSRMPSIRSLHDECDDAIEDLADALEALGADADPDRLRRIARSRVFLPGRREWEALMEEADTGVPHAVLRLFLLNRRWREVGTIFYKCCFCNRLVLGELEH
ncbi:hypothetical protein ACFFMN_15180 [Planobispora siamensis]|uniref:Uncharacterized protein n=1 Tax=Planobispora siamensis TaxID=936338 RepID=A0A8J3SRA7_9ACTN|nr:hypothetical protein [Planobispora siamensis]GIH97285.1 hypothetical protein Psi01_79150 [Planobispora siamensis]